jgi:hypothetical protein
MSILITQLFLIQKLKVLENFIRLTQDTIVPKQLSTVLPEIQQMATGDALGQSTVMQLQQ